MAVVIPGMMRHAIFSLEDSPTVMHVVPETEVRFEMEFQADETKPPIIIACFANGKRKPIREHTQVIFDFVQSLFPGDYGRYPSPNQPSIVTPGKFNQ